MISEVKKLASTLILHKKLYYRGEPIISDAAFDTLESRLREIAPEHPVLSLVGSEEIVSNKVHHARKMLSLDKVYDPSALKDWCSEPVVAMHKVDGVSGSLLYKDGVIFQASTRGNGSIGENITDKALWMGGFLSHIPTDDHEVEVRGEICITLDNFALLSAAMEARGLAKPSSPRNIVAGLLSRKTDVDLCSYLTFLAFDIYYSDRPDRYTHFHRYLNDLRDMGFEGPGTILIDEAEDIPETLANAREFMKTGDYLIDGVVFIYDDMSTHKSLGYTSHHPKYKMAFKYASDEADTTINSITWQVSRNGVLTPVAEVEPVELSGATISRVTLHNFDIVQQHGLKAGAVIRITRSGEVIPKFLSVVEVVDDDICAAPRFCPCCGNALILEGVNLICRHTECIDQVVEQVVYFVAKMKIDDLGPSRIRSLVKSGVLQDASDLYRLDLDDMLSIPKTKDKTALKLLANIEKSYKVDFATFLTAIGIAGGGKSTCDAIVKAGYYNMRELCLLTTPALIANVERMADTSATTFMTSLTDNFQLLTEFRNLGFDWVKPKAKKKTKTFLTGARVCITGKLSKPRAEIVTQIESMGGIAVGSVSTTTHYLLNNDVKSTSSKNKRAQELGIEIISEDRIWRDL